MSTRSHARTLARSHALGLVLLVAGVVLWRFPAGHDSFMEPKFALWSGGLALILGGAVLTAFRGASLWLVVSPTALAFLACVAWAELSTTWASSPLLARRAIGNWWTMLATLLLVQHVVWSAPRRGPRWMLPALALLGVVVAGWTLLEDFGVLGHDIVSRLSDWRGFISASLGNTTHLGDLLGLAMLPALLLLLFARGRTAVALWLAACVALAAAMVVCFSFHSNVALIVGALIVLVGLGRRRRLLIRHWRRVAILLALWAAVLVFYFADVPGNPHRPGIAQQAFASERLAYGWDSRLLIWSNTLEMIRIHPWLGWGAGCFAHGYPQQASAWVVNHPTLSHLAGSFTNAAHSEILQTWAEQGITGLALWIVLFALHFQACGRLMRHPRGRWRVAGLWLTAMTVMWLVHAQMNFPLQMPVGRLMLVLLLATAAALDVRSRASARRLAVPLSLPLRGWRLVLASVVVLGLVSFPVGHAAWRHEVQRQFARPYEMSRAFLQRRAQLREAGAPPDVLAQWADSELSWATIRAFEEVLDLDADFTDARSGLMGFLVEVGLDLRGGESETERRQRQSDQLLRAAIAHGPHVLAGLQVGDIFRHLARAHEALGERDEARRHWLTFFERRPAAQRTPDFARWWSDAEFRRHWEAGLADEATL